MHGLILPWWTSSLARWHSSALAKWVPMIDFWRIQRCRTSKVQVEAGRRPADDDAAHLGRDEDARGERLLPDVLEDDVGPLLLASRLP